MNIEKRVSQLEELHAPKKELPTAWIATVECDGSVSASHIQHGKHEFDNVDEFEAFRKEKGISEGDFIQVVIVNAKDCKGEPPKEL